MFFNKYFYFADERVGKMFPIIIDHEDQKSDANPPKSKQRNGTISSPAPISPRSKKRRDSIYDYKSDAVKKIEEIAKNRDERRQKQAEERAFKDQFALNDLTNPHFEFAQMISDAKTKIHFQPLRLDDEVVENQITVCVRKRPLNARELLKNEIDVITVYSKNQLIVHEPRTKFNLTKYLENQNFRFDYVFDECCHNETVYKFTAKPLVKTVFQGGMATCFAYGQTGSGKTHTMGGEFKGKQQNIRNGIYGLVAQDIFHNLSKHPKFTISASFFEIYGKFAFDLLEKRKRLRVLEDGRQVVQVVGLNERPIGKIEDILSLIKEGSMVRTSGQTSANSNSSRSHAVLQIILRKFNSRETYGKFSLIDLAGNERGADTLTSSRQTQMEGADINRSLLALKECIRALGKKGKHCPFRESILTKILRDSFIGEKSRTCMIALISPNIGSVEHTLNTLRYADRVKELVANDFNKEQEPEEEEEVEEEEAIAEDDNEEEEEADETEEEETEVIEAIGEVDIDIANIEWEVLECTSNVIDTCENFQKMAKQLMDCCRKEGYDKYEFARNWKNLLREMIEIEREAYVKVSEFCDALQD